MNMKLLEMNSMILMLGNRLRELSKLMAQAHGHKHALLTVERDEVLREYETLCKTTAALIA